MRFKPTHNHIKPKRLKSASAIITALFIMALVTIAATTIALQLEINIKHTELMLKATQKSVAINSVQTWAEKALADRINKLKDNTSFTDPAPIVLPTSSFDNITVSAKIIDAQSRFNLNTLKNVNLSGNAVKEDKTIRAFVKLIQTAVPDIDDTKAKGIVISIAKELHTRKNTIGNLRYQLRRLENIGYAEQAIRTMNHRRGGLGAFVTQPLMSITELRALRGVDQKLYNALKPFIIALPSNAPLNINSAPIELINSLSETLTLETSTLIAAERKTQGYYKSLNEFTNSQTVTTLALENPLLLSLSVSSQYYLLITKLEFESQKQVWYTLLETQKKQKSTDISTVWRSLDTP